MKTHFKILAGLLVLSTLVTGCAKDRDLDDYKAEQLSQSEADLSSVSGRYSGYLKSNQDGSNLGALEMTLSVTTQVLPSTNEAKASATPLLETLVAFKGAVSMQIAATNARYDSGLYQSDIVINRDGTNQTLKVVAQIANGKMTGTIFGDGYDQVYGGSFVLNLNGQNLDQLSVEQASAPNILFQDATYSGSTQFVTNGKAGVSKNVSMVLLNPETTSEANFLTLLVPVKPVSITLNFGAGAAFLLTGTLDQRTSTLTGVGTDPLAPGAGGAANTSVTGGSSSSTTTSGTTAASSTAASAPGGMSLSCTYNTNSSGYDCTLLTATSSGPAAFINVAAGTAKNPTNDETSTRANETYAYTGKADLGGGDVETVTMTAVYPARTRTQEVTDLLFPNAETILEVSLVIGADKSFGVTFSQTKWDAASKTLDATFQYTNTTVTSTLSLACQGFTFGKPPYNFNCQYLSSSRGANVGLTFKSTP